MLIKVLHILLWLHVQINTAIFLWGFALGVISQWWTPSILPLSPLLPAAVTSLFLAFWSFLHRLHAGVEGDPRGALEKISPTEGLRALIVRETWGDRRSSGESMAMDKKVWSGECDLEPCVSLIQGMAQISLDCISGASLGVSLQWKRGHWSSPVCPINATFLSYRVLPTRPKGRPSDEP